MSPAIAKVGLEPTREGSAICTRRAVQACRRSFEWVCGFMGRGDEPYLVAPSVNSLPGSHGKRGVGWARVGAFI